MVFVEAEAVITCPVVKGREERIDRLKAGPNKDTVRRRDIDGYVGDVGSGRGVAGARGVA